MVFFRLKLNSQLINFRLSSTFHDGKRTTTELLFRDLTMSAAANQQQENLMKSDDTWQFSEWFIGFNFNQQRWQKQRKKSSNDWRKPFHVNYRRQRDVSNQVSGKGGIWKNQWTRNLNQRISPPRRSYRRLDSVDFAHVCLFFLFQSFFIFHRMRKSSTHVKTSSRFDGTSRWWSERRKSDER